MSKQIASEKQQAMQSTFDALRDAKKKRLLTSLGTANNVTLACKAASIGRDTYYRWIKEEFITEADITEAYERYQDSIRAELLKRALTGYEKPLYQNGRAVKNANGKQVMIRTVDNRLLLALAQKVLPELKERSLLVASDGTQYIDGSIQSDLPPEHRRIVFDTNNMTKDQFMRVHAVAMEMKDRYEHPDKYDDFTPVMLA